MQQRKEDPCVVAFRDCLNLVFGHQNVNRVMNDSPIPKWKVWTGISEVTFTWADRWPADVKPLPTAIELSAEGVKREIPLGRPGWLSELEQPTPSSGMLPLSGNCLCARTGFLPDAYLELRFPRFPHRRVMIHIHSSGEDFKSFLTRIATRLASRGPDRTYAGEMSTNPS